nr:hypothetical protein [Longispora sp. (in: high G+C Gram-positive bacteria)]
MESGELLVDDILADLVDINFDLVEVLGALGNLALRPVSQLSKEEVELIVSVTGMHEENQHKFIRMVNTAQESRAGKKSPTVRDLVGVIDPEIIRNLLEQESEMRVDDTEDEWWKAFFPYMTVEQKERLLDRGNLVHLDDQQLQLALERVRDLLRAEEDQTSKNREAGRLAHAMGLAPGEVIELSDDRLVIAHERDKVVINCELKRHPSYTDYWPQEIGEEVTLIGRIEKFNPFESIIFDSEETVVRQGHVLY